MAKAPEKDAKKEKAPAEDMIEKPREPMFSKLGMMVMVGSIVLSVVICVSIFMMLSGGGGSEPKPDEKNAKTVFENNQVWMPLDNITANVMSPGGKTAAIRFSVSISFAGDPEMQNLTVAAWQAEGRLPVLRGLAGEVMGRYDSMAVRDQNFRDTFARALMAEMNAKIQDKVARVYITELRPPN